MKLIYIFVLIALINSKDYKIVDVDPYKSIYYANDMLQRKEDILIYKFEPKSEKRNIFLLFLGHSNEESFEFYLYDDPDVITFDENNHIHLYMKSFLLLYNIYLNFDLFLFLHDCYIFLNNLLNDYFHQMLFHLERYKDKIRNFLHLNGLKKEERYFFFHF